MDVDLEDRRPRLLDARTLVNGMIAALAREWHALNKVGLEGAAELHVGGEWA